MPEVKRCVCCKEARDGECGFYLKNKETGRYDTTCKKCRIEGRVAAKSKTHKICKHCGIEKTLDEYQAAGGGKWRQPYCKPCDSERKKKHRLENIEYQSAKSAQYYKVNFKRISERAKKDTDKRREERIASGTYRKRSKPPMSIEERKSKKSNLDRIYREKNAVKIAEMKKRYYIEKGLTQAKERQARLRGDISHTTKKRLRGRIYAALKRGIKSDGTMQLLGCDIDFFKKHFQGTFTDGMTWEKYLSGEIDIDHIRPCALYDLSNPEEQRKCFHYSNMQALWHLDNLRKAKSYKEKSQI